MRVLGCTDAQEVQIHNFWMFIRRSLSSIISPGEVMLVPSVYEKKNLERVGEGANRSGLTFAVDWYPFYLFLLKNWTPRAISVRFSPFLGVFGT